jgi:predicted amidohydrolase
MVVDPYGMIQAETQHCEDVVCANIDLNKIKEISQSIPVWKQKKWDLYTLEYNNN